MRYFLQVILPAHQANENLRQAIISCIEALPTNSKILLIDTTLDAKLRMFFSHPLVTWMPLPGGSYMEALTKGLNFSSATYIALMNSDDLVAINRFARQIEVIEGSSADLVFTKMVKFRDKPIKDLPSLLGDIVPEHYTASSLLLGSYGANASWLFKRSWAIRNNVFIEAADESDWQIAMRVFPNSKIVGVNEPLYFYRMHEQQVTRTGPKLDPKFLQDWRRLNAEFKLPELSDYEILALTKTAMVRKMSSQKIDNLRHWVATFKDLVMVGDSENLETLLFRRFAILNFFARKRLISPIPIRIYVTLVFELIKLGRFVRK